jgi:hypothetical protein
VLSGPMKEDVQRHTSRLAAASADSAKKNATRIAKLRMELGMAKAAGDRAKVTNLKLRLNKMGQSA